MNLLKLLGIAIHLLTPDGNVLSNIMYMLKRGSGTPAKCLNGPGSGSNKYDALKRFSKKAPKIARRIFLLEICAQ